MALLAVGALWGLITAQSPITARVGGDVTLSCHFPTQPGLDLQRLTLTWQKERAGAEALVVHSYYYGRNQLARQDEAYRNRTRLDPEGLAQGNATLTLRGVHPQDQGIYRCHVYSELGGTVETRELTVNQTSLAQLPGIAGSSAGSPRLPSAVAGLGGSWVPLLGLCLALIVPAVMTSPTCPPQDVQTPPADKSWPPASPGHQPGQRKFCAGSQTLVLKAALREPCALRVNATSQHRTQRAQPFGESPGGRALDCESGVPGNRPFLGTELVRTPLSSMDLSLDKLSLCTSSSTELTCSPGRQRADPLQMAVTVS